MNKKLYISHEAIKNGAVRLYTEFVDSALRSTITNDRLLLSKELLSDKSENNLFLMDKLKDWVKKYPIVSAFIRKLLKKKSGNEYSEAEVWIDNLEMLPSDVIILIPHIVQHDKGSLDRYYEAISKRRFVCVIHDLHPFHFPDQWSSVDLDVLKKRYKLLSKSAQKIIVHNEYTKSDVSEKLGIDPLKITVIKLPAFLEKEDKTIVNHHDVLNKYGIKKPYALWASSSTSKHKNHDNLILAWSDLKNKNININLVCTGSTEPRFKELVGLIKALDVGDVVNFTGGVKNNELQCILRNAELAICPTLFEGGGPVPAAEAVMASIPVAVSNIPQAKELFDNKEDMVSFFNPNSYADISRTVEEILSKYDSYLLLAQSAQAKYKKMRSWELAANCYWNVFEEIY